MSISSTLSEANLRPSKIMNGAPDNLDKLDHIFSHLTDGTWSKAFVGDWMSAVLVPFTPRANHDKSMRSDHKGWVRILLKLHIVDVCAALGKEDIYAYGDTCVQAFKILEAMDAGCTWMERPKLLHDMADAKWFDVCLWALNAPGFTRQAAAVRYLEIYEILHRRRDVRLLLTEINDLLVKATKFAQPTNTDQAMAEWRDPRLAFQWDSKRCVPHSVQDWLRESTAMDRHSAIRTVANIVLRDSRIGMEISFSILDQHPELIDCLLDIASRPRNRFPARRYPDTHAMRILNHLLRPPGPYGSALWTSFPLVKERALYRRSLDIFLGRPDSLSKLVDIYKKTTHEVAEGHNSLKSKIFSDPELGVISAQELRNDLEDAIRSRSYLQTSCQRILSNLTYDESVPPAYFLSVLHLAYMSCYRLPTADEMKTTPSNAWVFIERGMDSFSESQPEAAVESDVVLGRILFLRIIFRNLSDGKTLDNMSSGLSTELAHYVRQTSPIGIVEKIMRSTSKRHVIDGIEAAQVAVSQNKFLSAKWKFISMTELCSAVLCLEMVLPRHLAWRQQLTQTVMNLVKSLVHIQSVCRQLRHDDDALLFEAEKPKNPLLEQVNLPE